MTTLSPDHKLPPEDGTLDTLLHLSGEIMALGGGFWVKIEARVVPPSANRPHGIGYALCLFNSADERVICYDNAHPISVGSGPAKKQTAVNDHLHRGETVKPYPYTDAGTLLSDFWDAVYKVLKTEGVS